MTSTFIRQSLYLVYTCLAVALIVYIFWYYNNGFQNISGSLEYVNQQEHSNTSVQNVLIPASQIIRNRLTIKDKINILRKRLKNKFQDIQFRRLNNNSNLKSGTTGDRNFKDVLSAERINKYSIKFDSNSTIKPETLLRKSSFLQKKNQMTFEKNLQNVTPHLKRENSNQAVHIGQPLNKRTKLDNLNSTDSIREYKRIYDDLTKPLSRQTNRNFSYICPRFVGRLGNALFQYASTLGIGESKGMKIGISRNDEIAEVFDVPLLPAEDSDVCLHAKPLYNQENKMCSFSERVYRFSNKSDVSVKSENYLQSWKYFKNVKSVVRKNLEFKASLKEEAILRLKNVTEDRFGKKSSGIVFIGVHVRRGDYLDRLRNGYLVATKEYIFRSLKLFRSLFKKRLFLVFTEGIEESMQWCKQHIVGDDIIFMFENERTAASDLCLLSMCNHTIMTVGTYGWWGAWLANGLTIYAKDFATPGSGLRTHFSSDGLDYYLPEWIGI